MFRVAFFDLGKKLLSASSWAESQRRLTMTTYGAGIQPGRHPQAAPCGGYDSLVAVSTR